MEKLDNSFKNFLYTTEVACQKIIQKKISESIISFSKNISYVFIGTILSTIFSFIFNVFAGRLLGLEGYGKFTLINSIAVFLSIPMLLGINIAMVKYNSEKSDYERQKEIISTTYILIGLFSLIIISIYIIFESQISKIFSIQIEFYYHAIFFALLSAIYTLIINTLQSLHKMKHISIFKLAFGIILLISFIIYIKYDIISVRSALMSSYLAYIIPSTIIFISLLKYIKLDFKIDWAKTLIKYGLFNLFTSISYTVYINIDKILINTYMSVIDVGLYNAYYRSSISIVSVLSGVIATVMFPTISKYEDKKTIIKSVDKLIPYLIVFVFLLGIISQILVLKLYGNEYTINYSLILLFSITGTLFAWYDIYAWIFNSMGLKGVKLTMLVTGTIAICDIVLNIYLIPVYGLHGAIGATAISYTIGMCILFQKHKMLLS